jgi:hypothetical protein
MTLDPGRVNKIMMQKLCQDGVIATLSYRLTRLLNLRANVTRVTKSLIMLVTVVQVQSTRTVLNIQ